MRLKMASRKSDLARIQLHRVGRFLEENLKVEPEYLYRESLGDKNQDIDLAGSANKGLFTSDFYDSLVNKEVDLVVHSWKDLPIEDKKTTIALTLHREDCRDLLLVKKESMDRVFEEKTLNILTSSPRREFLISHHLKDLFPVPLESINFTPIRGNIPTRMAKLMASPCDGLVIAKAAIDRMLSAKSEGFEGVSSEIRTLLDQCYWMVLPLSLFPSAAAQGALAVEVLKGTPLEKQLRALNFSEVYKDVVKERETLKEYGGGCHAKLGVNYLTRDYGNICYFFYEEEGRIKSESQFSFSTPKGQQESAKVDQDKIWPQLGAISAKRKELPVEMSKLANADGLWVSKEFALPRFYQPNFDQKIWTSGLKTWKKLARRGIWVNGSAESLGENEDMQLAEILDSSFKWAKLSHDQAPEVGKQLVPTYNVRWSFEKSDFLGKTHFYWMSGVMFEEALKVEPELINKIHYCGPGHTLATLTKHLPQVRVALSYDDFIKEVIK